MIHNTFNIQQDQLSNIQTIEFLKGILIYQSQINSIIAQNLNKVKKTNCQYKVTDQVKIFSFTQLPYLKKQMQDSELNCTLMNKFILLNKQKKLCI